jgi:hypothetical protein
LSKHFVLSLPERVVRALIAALGGAVHETAELVLPRLVRRSRLYEVTAKNVLRVAIELVGRVEGSPTVEETPVKQIAIRKTAGNVVELSSFAAFGFSPLWLLAAASDIAHGSRVYLGSLVAELKAAGVLAKDAEARSVDELLGVLERGAGRTALLVDLPPLELAELRRSVAELRAEADSLPSPPELAALYRALRREARREDRTLLDVSTGVGLAFLTSARNVGREHLVVPYGEDWEPLRREGFADYARRIGAPYARAIASHLDSGHETHTERLLTRVSPRRATSPGR